MLENLMRSERKSTANLKPTLPKYSFDDLRQTTLWADGSWCEEIFTAI